MAAIMCTVHTGIPVNLLTMLTKQSEEISQLKQEMRVQNEQQKEQSSKYDDSLKLLESTLKQCTMLQDDLHAEKQHSAALQERLQLVETHSLELQQQLDSLTERMEAVEVGVQAVEQLWVVSRDEIHFSNDILGTGGWGYVKEATYRGRKVAAKCLHRNIVSPHNQKQFEKEIKISARCRHRNLIEFIGAVLDHPAIILIELMDANLRDALADRRVSPNHIHPIIAGVAQGLSYLHNIQPHPIIHRDVSAPNVLLKADDNGWIAKLSDLGSAQFAHIAHTVGPGCVLYAAPEVRQELSASQQTEKIDVYSYGVLLIEILTREMPTGSIEDLVRSLEPKWTHFVPLITNCTNTIPNRRPSMKQIIDQLDTIVI